MSETSQETSASETTIWIGESDLPSVTPFSRSWWRRQRERGALAFLQAKKGGAVYYRRADVQALLEVLMHDPHASRSAVDEAGG